MDGGCGGCFRLVRCTYRFDRKIRYARRWCIGINHVILWVVSIGINHVLVCGFVSIGSNQ